VLALQVPGLSSRHHIACQMETASSGAGVAAVCVHISGVGRYDIMPHSDVVTAAASISPRLVPQMGLCTVSQNAQPLPRNSRAIYQSLRYQIQLHARSVGSCIPQSIMNDDAHQKLSKSNPQPPGPGAHELKKSHPVWVSDSEARRCYLCGTDFTVLRRRHHCRRW